MSRWPAEGCQWVRGTVRRSRAAGFSYVVRYSRPRRLGVGCGGSCLAPQSRCRLRVAQNRDDRPLGAALRLPGPLDARPSAAVASTERPSRTLGPGDRDTGRTDRERNTMEPMHELLQFTVHETFVPASGRTAGLRPDRYGKQSKLFKIEMISFIIS
jgi:hypothetical protein